MRMRWWQFSWSLNLHYSAAPTARGLWMAVIGLYSWFEKSAAKVVRRSAATAAAIVLYKPIRVFFSLRLCR